MSNVWKIFRKDLKRLGTNTISWVVAIGLIVVPGLYAWFCIYAFWAPYDHTENLKVAVVSVDEGYDSSLLPLQLNIGNRIVEELRDNRQMDWVFVSRKKAIEGVKSGDYYAALVIPEDFSRNLLSILSNDVESAEMNYYINEKENAIAAKVSSQGASTIQKTIDEAVAQTTTKTLLNTLNAVSDSISDEEADQFVQQLRQKLRSVSNELDSSADSLDNIYQINTSLTNLMKVTDVLLSETGSRTSDAVGELKSRELFSDSADGDLDALSGKIDEVLQNTEQAYSSIDSSVNSYLQDMNTDAETISASMNTFGDRAQTMIDHYQELQWSVEELSDSLPEGMNASRKALTDLSEMLDYSIRQQTRIRDTLREGASDLTSVSSDALQYKQDLSNYINQCDQDLENMSGRYRDEMKPQIQKLSESLTAVSQSVQTVSDGLGSTSSEMKNAADSVSGQMDSMNQNLNDTGALLRADAEKIRQILDQTDETGNAGGRELLKKLLNNDTDTVGSYFSSVVKLDSHVLYPVANFGTAMTPFYTCLAIWVGAVILVSMLQVNVSEKTKKTLKNEKNWQLYLGRYGIFLLFSLLQSLLIALGDLLYLGVPCAHPVPFVLTCMYTGFVFVTLIYTLTISFGNIGKAAAVIILVFQVAGSGGTLPIEMTPPFFHIFYPLLPVTHSMNAMRECIAGFYGSDYMHELAILSIYVWISLLLGLVLRNPMINMNRKFVEMVEDTKVM